MLGFLGFLTLKMKMLPSSGITYIIRSGDKIENIDMGGACSTYGGRERCVQGSGGET
jgi:hypothetical protein